MKVEDFSVGEVVIGEVDLPTLPEEDIVAINEYGNLLRAEARPEDPPRPVELTRANIQNIPPFVSVREFWARDPDGTIAATGEAVVMRTDDNKHLCNADISVRPDRRNRGIAKALLRLIVGVAESEGRTLLMGGTSERVPAGEAFATRVGAEAGLKQHVNRLLLAEVDRGLVSQWIAEGPARAEGYSLFTIDGPYPDELAEPLVDLAKVMNSAPRDELDMEDWEFTVEQLRQWEKSMEASGDERWSLVARHDATGELVGFTEVVYNPKIPPIVHQMATGVRHEHRGHALGKWLKAAMLERVLSERPAAEEIRTGNADSNDAMLGINRQLGFRAHIASTIWQVSVERARGYLGSSD